MRYDFSSQFLRIMPPDTSFGEAWESLCEVLLRKQLGTTNILRLHPPDRGIDLLYRSESRAFQCKSTEQGAYGTIDAEESAKSLETAIKHRHTLEWVRYCFATNAEYTGVGYEKIMMRARSVGLMPRDVEFLGPLYWDDLCSIHSDLVKDRFDYRVSVSEKHLLEVLKKTSTRFSAEELSNGAPGIEAPVVFANNLNQVEIELPLLDNLRAEAHLTALLELLGLSYVLNSASGLGIALKPLLSLRFRGKELSLFARLRDLNIQDGEKIELHFKLGLEALAAYDEIIQRFPDNLAAHTGRAEVLKSLGRLEDALRSYDAIIVAQPENVVAKTGRAEVLKSMGRFKEALDAYNDAIAEHPESIVAKNGLAEVLNTMGRWNEALAAYDAIVAEHPENAIAKTGRAEVLKAQGKLVEAEAAFDSVIAEHPEDVVAKTGRAEVLKAQGKLVEGEFFFDSDIAEHPERVITDAGRVHALIDDGQFAEVLERYSPSIGRLPNPIEYRQEQMIPAVEALLQSTIWAAAKRLLLMNELDIAGASNSFPYCGWNPYGSNSPQLVA